MEVTHIIGYLLAVVIGITLGLIGSGGSILSVPILTYIMGVEPFLATAYSLFVVGSSSLIGGIQKANQKLVDFRKVALFGIPTILSVFITRKILLPSIPEVIYKSNSFTLQKPVLIMIVFAVVMMVASIKMIKPTKQPDVTTNKISFLKIMSTGVFIGFVAGFVGAGGGFLIIPALLILAKTPMKMAIGTSLFIIAIQSLIGFLGDVLGNQIIDWQLLLSFTFCSIIGIFIGNHLSKTFSGDKLKVGFGWFVLVMGIYVFIKELSSFKSEK